jgi:hypothetical protein
VSITQELKGSLSEAHLQLGQGLSKGHTLVEQKQQEGKHNGLVMGRRTSSLGGTGAGASSMLRRTSTLSNSGALNSTVCAHVDGLPPIRRTSTLVLPPVTGLPQQQQQHSQQQVIVKVQHLSEGRGAQNGAWGGAGRKSSSFGGSASLAGADKWVVGSSDQEGKVEDEGEGFWKQPLTKADVRRLTAIVPGGPPVPRVSELAAAARPFPGGMLSATGFNGGMEGIWS